MAHTELHFKLLRLGAPKEAENHATSNSFAIYHPFLPTAHLAHVPARVGELRPPEAEDPVDGLGAVDDLEAAVGGEERVAVGEEAEVTLPHEGDLKQTTHQLYRALQKGLSQVSRTSCFALTFFCKSRKPLTSVRC